MVPTPSGQIEPLLRSTCATGMQSSYETGRRHTQHISSLWTCRNSSLDQPSLQAPQNSGRDNQDIATLPFCTSSQWTATANKTLTSSRLSTSTDHSRHGLSWTSSKSKKRTSKTPMAILCANCHAVWHGDVATQSTSTIRPGVRQWMSRKISTSKFFAVSFQFQSDHAFFIYMFILIRSHFSVNPILEMLPARRNYANSGWATPSAVQLNPAYLDPMPWLDLKDTHFYKAGNHYVLHHLDYYLMHKRAKIIQDYIPEQLTFWKDLEQTLETLESELRMYTQTLPAETTLGIPTRTLVNKVHHHIDDIGQRRIAAQHFLPSRLLTGKHHPVWLVNKLLEEVKPPPPFIPTLTRRHSFS